MKDELVLVVPGETVYQALDRNYELAKKYFGHNFWLKATARIDTQRLIDAAKKAGILYVGCDTPDRLAEEILVLREVVRRQKEIL